MKNKGLEVDSRSYRIVAGFFLLRVLKNKGIKNDVLVRELLMTLLARSRRKMFQELSIFVSFLNG